MNNSENKTDSFLTQEAKDVIQELLEINSGGGGGGTSDYDDLTNKPSINGVSLSGDMSANDLGLAEISDIPDISGLYTKPNSGIPKSDLASDVKTSLGKADTALQSFTETDPTVPSWAKAVNKPTYTASEVGALPVGTPIPSVDNTLTTQGAAADAKATGDAIDEATNAINNINSEISEMVKSVNSVSPDANGNVNVAVDQTLVDNWLDEHPEATTTVQDGSITYNKLNSEVYGDISGLKNALNEKAPAIEVDTDKENSHVGLSVGSKKEITFYGNNKAFTTGRYINAKNIFPSLNYEGVYKGVTIIASGNFVTYNGQSTGYGTKSVNTYTIDTQPAGDYKFIVEMSAPSLGNSRTILCIYYDSAPSTKVQIVTKYITQSSIYEFTATESFSKISLEVNVDQNTTYDNYRTWYGVYPALGVIYDTELSVPVESNVSYTNDSLNPLATIDTMQHESVITYVADTKTYIDEHTPDIIGFWNDNVYALPEKFGAVGDGVADDTLAIQNCLQYAKTTGKAVRGYRTYKITSTIVLNGSYMDVYFKEITYTGNQAAISLENQNIVFKFNRITSSGIGISFGGSNPYARYCQIEGNRLTAESHGIEIKDLVLYCSVNIRILYSSNGNCIHRTSNGNWGGMEFTYRDCSLGCPNGYAAYNIQASHFYGVTVEKNCRYGYYNPIENNFFGCRHREQTDAMGDRIYGNGTNNAGALFTFTVEPNGDGIYSVKYINGDAIPWYSIDTTAIQSYAKISDIDTYQHCAYTGDDVGAVIKGYGATGRLPIGGKLYFISGYMVLSPAVRKCVHLNLASLDFRKIYGRTDNEIADAYYEVANLATDYIISTSHSNIYFNSFFGAVGYNDITITQENGNTATVYDKFGNLLFDGTNEGNGKWRFTCIVDYTLPNRYDGTTSWVVYDGTNERWEIEKIS